jgi:hypothetical protein
VDADLKVLQVAKKDCGPAENNDAYSWGASLVVAVSDGASTTFESKKWADLLTSSFVAEPQFERTHQQVLAWSARLAAKWRAALPLDGDAPWWDVASAYEGAAATLVGVRFDRPAADGGTGTWECVALGDACFFHVSGGELVKAFPIKDPEDFGNVPPLICTDPEKTEASLDLLLTDQGTWSPGDRFFLLTDALAEWFLRGRDHKPAPWDILEGLGQEQFAARVPEWRANGLRNDDVTAVIIVTSAVTHEVSHATEAPQVPETTELTELTEPLETPEAPQLDELDDEDGPPPPDEEMPSDPPARPKGSPAHTTVVARPRRRANRHTSSRQQHQRIPLAGKQIPLAGKIIFVIVLALIVISLIGYVYFVKKYL